MMDGSTLLTVTMVVMMAGTARAPAGQSCAAAASETTET